MVDFTKKSLVVVSGASKGIGRTIALELAKILHTESTFVLLARNNEGLQATKKALLDINQSLIVKVFVQDLSKPNLETYEQIFATIDQSNVEVAYMFHNAGHVGSLKQTTDLGDLQEWRDYFDLNLFSAILLNNAFLKHILAPKILIINITSLVGRVPFANMAMYGSAKASRELFFKVLALERPQVTVLNYSPGPVLTDMFNSICEEAQSEELRSSFKATRDSSVLTCEQTVAKLLEVLGKGDYKSGDTIDYFDRV